MGVFSAVVSTGTQVHSSVSMGTQVHSSVSTGTQVHSSVSTGTQVHSSREEESMPRIFLIWAGQTCNMEDEEE